MVVGVVGWEDGQNASVSSIIIHPHFDKGSHLANDIAVLKTAQDLQWGPTLRPICLPRLDSVFKAGTMVTVAGWGSTICRHSSKHLLIFFFTFKRISCSSVCL